MKDLIGLLNLLANVGEAAVFLVLGHIVGVNRHDDAAETGPGQFAHVRVGPQGTVGANHGMNAPFGGISRHGAQIAMYKRFASDEKEVTNVIFYTDVDYVARFGQGDSAALFGIEAIDRKAAEITLGVADVC